ncbi:MAG: response regulator transcription factor [Leadbetterella sp.]|nr:response regulator transcription factor [Leadbetterella sp.]
MSQTIRIAIIDDEQLITEGIRLLLSSEASIRVSFTALDGDSFLDTLGQLSPEEFPDIALIDIQMQPMNGFELVEILRKDYPQLKIMVLSSHYKSSVFGYMIKLGISAFLPKNSDRNSFIEAIRQVHTKGVFFSATDHEMLLSYMNNPPGRKTLFSLEDDLSEREREVIKLICEQCTNQEIAERLNLSPRTVESHRQRILEKNRLQKQCRNRHLCGDQ